MSTVSVSVFGGMQPRTSDRLLPDNGAIRAENVKLQSGALVPLNNPRLLYTPRKTFPLRTIYRARNGQSEGWLSWSADVDVVRVPLPAEAQARYCWTGDGEPKIAEHTEAVSGGMDDYPHLAFALGIPLPQDRPTVSVTGGTLTTVTRFYAFTFWSQKNEETGLSPISASAEGKTDGTWTIGNIPKLPENSGACSAAHVGGITTVTCTGYHWLRKGDPVLLDGRRVTVYEVVPPGSGATGSTIFRVLGNFAGSTGWARETPWNVMGMKRRLYRTTGTAGSWQLVADDVTGTTYTDVLSDAQILGDELISDGWLPPPAGLQGLFVHSSGALGGFAGNLLCFSEPLQPHAWPKKYQRSTDYPIVGCAPFGSSVGVATTGNPYIATGVEPASMTCEKLDGSYPCVSKRSVISVGDGVLYAANHGLLYLNMNGVRVDSEGFYTRDEWLKLNPGSMTCEHANGRTYVLYLTRLGETGILFFEGTTHVVISVAATEIYADQSTGYVFFADAEGIKILDPEEMSYPMVAAWRSKEFTFPTPCNLGAAKIDYKLAIEPAVLDQLKAEREEMTVKNKALLQAGGFFGAMNCAGYNERGVNASEAYYVPPIPPSNDIQFVLRVGKKVVFSKTVRTNKAFRLPSGFKTDHFSFEISTQGSVDSVKLAETMEALKQA